MKTNKLLALILAAVMIVAMVSVAAADRGDYGVYYRQDYPTAPAEETPAEETPVEEAPAEEVPAEETPVEEAPAEEAPAEEAAVEEAPAELTTVVDFENGSAACAAVFEGMANSASADIAVVEYNGSNALKVTNNNGKVPYVAIDVYSLLDGNVADVAAVEVAMGIENPDGKFYACSGQMRLFTDGSLGKIGHDWSVYMEKKNPKTAVFSLDGEAFSETSPLMILSLTTDNGASKGATPAIMYIDNIRFLDADGNALPVNPNVSFNAPDGFGGDVDMTNLQFLGADAVELAGMGGKSGAAWSQDGVEMTQEFLDALVPGAVIEISFASDNGDIWLVLPWAEAGWTRVEQQTAVTNLSKTTAQITFEQISAILGDDISKWGAMLQCEASGSWEVYSVKIGQPTGLKNLANKTDIPGFAKAGGAWSQDGVELSEDLWAKVVPGSVIEINYASESGDMWLVLPWAEAGWTRIEQQTAACNGSVCQITFEQIAAVLGEDTSKWGAMMQCESSGAWEVYSVSIAGSAFVNTKANTEIPGFQKAGGAWSQDGVELSEDLWAQMVPGAVITVQYESENGDLWIVLPWAEAGWTRIQQQTATCNGSIMQVTYEQIAEVLGDNVASWGAMLQCEASGAWTVYNAFIGTAA